MTKIKLLGKWTSTSLVVGNMIGSGVFMMPAILAAYGGISLLGWILSTIGALAIAILFSRLNGLFPGVEGGPYAYTRKGLGDFMAFLVAWGYWISVWMANTALAVAFTSYLTQLIPVMNTNKLYTVGSSLLIIWLLTFYNMLGVRKGGQLALVTVILKITPLILIGIWGLFYIDLEHFLPFNRTEESNFNVVFAAMAITFFSFLGVECATVPGDKVKNPKKTISFATIVGTIIAALVYLLTSVTVMGLIPLGELEQSNAPFSDAAILLWGTGAGKIVTLGALISVFGALNGWILLQGQLPEAIARNHLFPAIFKEQNKWGAPAKGLVISSLLSTVVLLLNYAEGLTNMFEFIALISTVLLLVPYFLSAVSYGMVKFKLTRKLTIFQLFIITVVLVFSTMAIFGSGLKVVIWGNVFVLLGIPVYFLMKKQQRKSR